MSSDWGKWGIALAVGIGLLALGWKVPYVMISMHVLLCVLLIVVVLLQSGKAADLAGAFGGAGSQTAFGPRGAATFLSKATTWCAIMFMLTSFSLALRWEAGTGGGGSLLERTQQPASPPAKTPEATPPAQTPPQTPASQPPAGGTPAPAQPAPAQPQPPKK
jgi:preprotein translocase subunit SecG